MGAVTTPGLFGTAGEAGLLHPRSAYHNPAMLFPVMIPPIPAPPAFTRLHLAGLAAQVDEKMHADRDDGYR